MPSNKNLKKASMAKNDEFYTRLSDIAKELKYYEKKHFEGKTVYCNCDDYSRSNFVKYFVDHFEELGLKRLIATCYKTRQTDLFGERKIERATHMEYDGNEKSVSFLEGDGSFDSSECTEMLRQSDILVSNPPFSRFRSYLQHIVTHEKQFLILGNQTVIARQEVFQLFLDNKMWLGNTNGSVKFQIPDYYKDRMTYEEDEQGRKWKSVNITWFTNIDVEKRHKMLKLTKKYDPGGLHKRYDTYPTAVNCDKISDIPTPESYGYDEKIGTPITMLSRYNPQQFILIGLDRYLKDSPHFGTGFKINGRETYARIIIKHRRPK